MSSARHYKTRPAGKSEYGVYCNKAKEFYQTMYQAEKVENWNAVGLNGVHAIISLIDAILVKYSGIRSSEDNHMAVIDLLTSSIGNRITDVVKKSQTAKRVIAKKNVIAYENREFLKSDALDMIKQVERFYRWAMDQL
ncbi:MAG: hypothetical protein KAJ18_02830 [Candidatus Omnitrophica bacterium]|nr:hypothetical protein [Candidatus Omnitrophota bacterium]